MNIKKIIKQILHFILKLIVEIYIKIQTSKIIQIFKKEYENIYLEKYYKKFGRIGKHTKIDFPNRIINPQYMFLGDNFSTLYNFRIEAIDEFYGKKYSPKINIGNNVIFNSDCHLGCINEIRIGNNVLVASRVFITDHFHGNSDGSDISTPPAFRELTSKGPVIIDDNVWIGEGVVILPGVTIGKNCIIGANSVVNKCFSDNSVIAGVPAKLIKKITNK